MSPIQKTFYEVGDTLVVPSNGKTVEVTVRSRFVIDAPDSEGTYGYSVKFKNNGTADYAAHEIVAKVDPASPLLVWNPDWKTLPTYELV